MQLWDSALSDAGECLTLAARLAISANSEVVKGEVVAQHRHYEMQTGRKFLPHHSFPEDAAVLDSFPRDLPLTNECFSAAHYLRVLAIAYFMQMYVTGGSSPLSVADNREAVVKDHREQVEKMAYPNPTELDNFRALVRHVKTARDKQIGHADGTEFAVRHQPNSVVHSVYVVPPQIWNELDAAIRRLQPTVRKILGNLMK